MLDIGLAADIYLWWSYYATVVLLLDVNHQQCLFLSRHLLTFSLLFHAVLAVVATYCVPIIISYTLVFSDSYSSLHYYVEVHNYSHHKWFPFFFFMVIVSWKRWKDFFFFFLRLSHNIFKCYLYSFLFWILEFISCSIASKLFSPNCYVIITCVWNEHRIQTQNDIGAMNSYGHTKRCPKKWPREDFFYKFLNKG